MVNEKQAKLLSYITDEPLSGELLAERLGVSRVAVWKMVQSLVQQGFSISASPDGYRCGDEYYDLSSLEKYSVNYHYLTASTMDLPVQSAEARPALVLAERQSGGKGRNDRSWISAAGGVYLTFYPQIKIPFALLYRAVFGMALAIASTIQSYGVFAQVKWPNDILVEERKIAGVLTRASGNMDHIETIALGAGINLNNHDLPQGAVCLSDLTRNHINRTHFTQRLLSKWSEYLDTLNSDAIDRLWEKNSATIGHEVRILQQGTSIEGVALSLGPGGALVVRRGAVEQYALYGDCLHI